MVTGLEVVTRENSKMFILTLPKTVKVGDTAECHINMKSAKVFFRDDNHLVIIPGDVREIVSREVAGDLVTYFCSDADGSKPNVIRATPPAESELDDDGSRYWIAINGASCAIAPMPMRNPIVTPRPQQLLGFASLEEAEHAQKVCLTYPMDKVREFLASLAPQVHEGTIRVMTYKDPEPSTKGPTTWLEDTRVI
jgi:hypothetical protein